jgi:hypothetical protein
MKWIDLHNVVLFVVLSAMSLALARNCPHRLAGGEFFFAGVTFVVLAGRVVAHGMDLRRTPDWKPYVVANALFNACATGIVFAIVTFLSN